MERDHILEEINLLVEELKLRSSYLTARESGSPGEATELLHVIHRLSDRVSVLKFLLEHPEPIPEEVPSHLNHSNIASESTQTDEIPAPPAPGEEKISGKKKTPDLYTIIDINEKYQFISELFNGNGAAYSDAIKELNDTGDQSHARELLSAFTITYGWDEENATVNRFIELVERRFN